MKFQPLNDLVLISPIEKGKTSGGIIIPSNAEEQLIIGRVEAIGDGVLLENGGHYKSAIKIGELVVYPYYSAETISDYENRQWHLVKMLELRSKIVEI